MLDRASTKRPKPCLEGQGRARLLTTLTVLALALLTSWWLAVSPPAQQAAEHLVPTRVENESVAPPSAREPSSEPLLEHTETQPPSPSSKDPAHDPKPPVAPEAPSRPVAQGVQAPAANVPVRQGPLEELSRRFASESRGATSERDEARVRAAFVDPAIPSELLHSAECRRSACRVELRWSSQRDAAYVLGLTRAVGTFSAPVAIEGAGVPDSDGVRPLVVYFGLVH